MMPDYQAALRLLAEYTAGSFNIDQLAGPSRARQRAMVMGALNGRKTPISQSGITALRAKFEVLAEVDMNRCIAARQDQFIDWAKKTHGHFRSSACSRTRWARRAAHPDFQLMALRDIRSLLGKGSKRSMVSSRYSPISRTPMPSVTKKRGWPRSPALIGTPIAPALPPPTASA